MPRFPTSLALLGALLAACALPLSRADCCFASAVTSRYVAACNDCTAPKGMPRLPLPPAASPAAIPQNAFWAICQGAKAPLERSRSKRV